MTNSESETQSDNLTWAIGRLASFIDASQAVHVASPSGVIGPGTYKTRSSDDEVVQQWAVVEQILARYLPDWQTRIQPPDSFRRTGYRWRDQREAAVICLSIMKSEAEVQRHLGDASPTMSAAGFHSWIWEAARPAWDAGLFEDAVDAAARNLNSQLRAKVGRKDIGEADLVSQAFSDKPGDEANARLRLPLPPHVATKTVVSFYGGIIGFGRGLFQAVRNPLAHEAPGAMGLTEQEALESLATLSLFARWIDRANVHRG